MPRHTGADTRSRVCISCSETLKHIFPDRAELYNSLMNLQWVAFFCVLEQARHSSSATMKLKEPLHFDNLQRASLTPAAFLCVCLHVLLALCRKTSHQYMELQHKNTITNNTNTIPNTFFLPDLHEKMEQMQKQSQLIASQLPICLTWAPSGREQSFMC